MELLSYDPVTGVLSSLEGKVLDFTLQSLGLVDPVPTLFISCGAKPVENEIQIRQMLEAVARECSGIVVVTGGTRYGVMQLVEDAFKGRVHLFGATPYQFIVDQMQQHNLTFEEAVDHCILKSQDAMILVKGGSFGCEVETLARLASVLSGGIKPVVVLQIRGGKISLQELKEFSTLQNLAAILPVTGAEPNPDIEAASALLSLAKGKFPHWYCKDDDAVKENLQAIIDSGRIQFLALPDNSQGLSALAQTVKGALGLH